MTAVFETASSLVDKTTSAVSELGHWRLPSFESPIRPGAAGPRRGSCFCWHTPDDHERCAEFGCACGGEFTRPVVGWLWLGFAVLRGGR